MNMKHVEACIEALLERATAENIAVKVGFRDAVAVELYRGNATPDTLFDMASVSKIIATTSLALMALERGLITLTDSVSRYFPCPPDKEAITVFHLLTHTMGIGHKALNQEDITPENVAERILEIPSDVPIGSDVRYSCPGFILLGKILEKVFDAPLDALLQKEVCRPLGMTHTGYLPKDKASAVNSNLTEALRGTVNDYNCRHLGGVAGNAGVFSNMRDMTLFARMLLDGGCPILDTSLFQEARKNHTVGMSESRGLGYLYVDERYTPAGGLFPVGSLGHCGHTGQSVFVHPESGLYAIILSDATISTVKKHGREKYAEVVAMRAAIHAAVKQDLFGTV